MTFYSKSQYELTYKQTVKSHLIQKKRAQPFCILKNANKLLKMRFFILKNEKSW